MSEAYPLNDTVKVIAIFRNQAKVPITTANGKVTIQRLSDGFYWNGASFALAATLLQMVKVGDGDTNSAGKWEYDYVSTSIPADDYLIEVTDGNSLAYNVPQVGEVTIGKGIIALVEIAAAGGKAYGDYDQTASTLTIYRYDDPTGVGTPLAVFDITDENGAPSGLNGRHFKMVPQ